MTTLPREERLVADTGLAGQEGLYWTEIREYRKLLEPRAEEPSGNLSAY